MSCIRFHGHSARAGFGVPGPRWYGQCRGGSFGRFPRCDHSSFGLRRQKVWQCRCAAGGLQCRVCGPVPKRPCFAVIWWRRDLSSSCWRSRGQTCSQVGLGGCRSMDSGDGGAGCKHAGVPDSPRRRSSWRWCRCSKRRRCCGGSPTSGSHFGVGESAGNSGADPTCSTTFAFRAPSSRSSSKELFLEIYLEAELRSIQEF